MMTLQDYHIIQTIHSGENTILYQGISDLDQQPVIIKILAQQYPSLEEITRLRHEYEILKNLDLAGIVKAFNFVNYQNSFALILEDFGGESLPIFLKEKKLNITQYLPIILQVIETLGQLHQNKIIHKDIKPQNLIINPETLQVKIADFSIASRLSKENNTVSHPSLLEGTIAYISPEQTGRMNRSIDYRTDYYSLGVTCYEMLTGQLPFQSDDPMELVHCHIAKKPVPPNQLNPEIPVAVSDIVMKLLKKNAEDRYQSAAGLKYDLEFCLTHLVATGEIPNFVAGVRDKSCQLLIPQKLYGREQEVEILLAAFSRVATDVATDVVADVADELSVKPTVKSSVTSVRHPLPELMLVSGYSGIGKSCLVHEIHKPIVRLRGYFITGKFDQFKRNIPYAALIQAFRELIQQLLTESSSQIAIWKEKLLTALGTNGQVIIDVIPELSLIIGQQLPTPQLGPTESQNRFNRVFKEFIRVFTQKAHPLVLFLDDLQWADSGSLKLIQLLLTDADSQYLLVIGAYRDNEVETLHATSLHPLIQTLEKIQQDGATVNHIIVKPLDQADVHQLIADTLRETQTVETRNFASLLFHKTAGNPFFLTQLLLTLYQEELLTFDFGSGRWQWDIEKIQAIGITDQTVVELVASNIQKLSNATQQVLKLAACIGNSFNLDVLAIVHQKSIALTAADLWTALQAGLILPLSHAYKMPLVWDWGLGNSQSPPIGYKFLHDRVQQAAYSLIPFDQKKETHRRIGQLLLKNTPTEERFANIFDIVNQLNVGADSITEQSEKYQLAELNLIAGKKAKTAAAYDPAQRYLNLGLKLLAEDSWNHEYELTLNMYVETVEAEYLITQFEQAKQLSQIALEKAKTLLEKVKLYEIRIHFYVAQNQMQAALDTGIQVLKLLGVSLSNSKSNSEPVLLPRLEDLAAIPTLTNPYQLAALRLLMTITPPAIIINPTVFSQIIVTVIKLCIEHGHAPLAACGYVTYGFFLCGVLKNIDSGYHAGQIGLKLLEQFKATELKSKVYSPFNGFIRHWKEHIKETLAPLLEGIQSGLETGDIEFAGYGAFHYGSHVFLVGEPLDYVAKQQTLYIELMLKIKQDFPFNYLKIWHQLTLNLQGKAKDKYFLIGESFNEETMLPYLQAANNSMSLFATYLAKAILSYLFKDSAQAVTYASLAAEYSGTVTGMAAFATHNFYYSLALLAQCACVENSKQQQYLILVESNQEKMRHWAEHAPMNYQHKYDLVSAELARVLGQFVEAMEYYDSATARAKEQGYIQDEALFNELAAEFYLSSGREKIAQTYMIEAYYGYIRWGAVAKVKDLEARYPQFFSRIATKPTSDISVTWTTKTTTDGSLAALDLSTVIKAYQAISQEIVLDRLLDKLMQTVMENAGAQLGLLFLEKSGKLVLASEGTVEPEKVIVLPFVEAGIDAATEERAGKMPPPQDQDSSSSRVKYTSSDLPVSVINYVQRTRESVVLNDAANEGLFTSDPYIVKHQPKSVLAMPVIYQGKLTGILYLENRSLFGAFTCDRLQVLSLLCTQVSISIENARLYKDLQTYSQELESKNQALQQSETREREKATQLEAALHQLQNTQLQLVQTEKMSSLGQMVAGIAHEINNPVNFIMGNMNHASGYTQDLLNLINLYQQHYPNPVNDIQDEIDAIDLEFLLADLPKILQSMNIGANRISEIVRTMRNFSRVDATQMKPADIHEGIDSTLMILQHRLKAQPHRPAIEVIKEYGNLPRVECFIGQLNQVFMNILANGIDALEESFVISHLSCANDKGQMTNDKKLIRIRTEVIDNLQVAIHIADNGPGMTEEVRSKLFNPFFTTKAVGKGTGIGLSISQQIVVDKHGGKIACISARSIGTEFMIQIPITQQTQENSGLSGSI